MELWFSLIFGVLLLFILRHSFDGPPEKLDDLKDVPLDSERLRLHAEEIAKSHGTEPYLRTARILLKRLDANYNRISAIYQYLNEKARDQKQLSPASEWILDNYYLIEEQAKETRQRLSQERFVKLQLLDRGYLKGYPRIFAIALELISHTDGRLDGAELVDFVRAYQNQRVLTMAEVWSLSLMIKVALLEYLRHLSDKIYQTETEWDEARRVAELDPKEQLAAIQKVFNKYSGRALPSFVEHLVRELRKADGDEEELLTYLDQQLLDLDISLDRLIEQEHFEQASRKISTGHAIVSLKAVSLVDWEKIFESLSRVEAILAHDPDGIYVAMDYESRVYYRQQVGSLARQWGVTETRVARLAVGLAKEAEPNGSRRRHVGYYLIGEGRKELISLLGGKGSSSYFHDYPSSFYYLAILLITSALVIPLTVYTYRTSAGSLLLSLIAATLTLLPASEIAVFLVNRLATRLVPPAYLPKLAFEEGIPAEVATIVVIPSLLPNEEKVGELLERLETYYLANREENLYFALAGDFKDASDATSPEDQAIIQAGLRGVERLNREYGEGKERFFYCQRERRRCGTQGRWTGWERKRGALVEFNRLLLGATDTTYSTLSPGLEQLAERIKYVITLDADTRLTLDTAKKLIGTMAHPLNQGVIDKKRGVVREGYGLVQPRIGIGIESANQSLFTQIFAGQGGIDPYTTAVSDIYQDLFGEGIFTGKGIYDLVVFHELLTEAIPEGSVLSHDLLEGSYLRTGLVTDLELVDGYPGTYSSFAARQHRWVRGDWQLLPWLFSRVRNRRGEKVTNPLSALSRWKILDNMRRSLLPVGQLLLLVIGLAWLPGNPYVWLTLAVLPLALPLFSGLLSSLLSAQPKLSLEGLRTSFLQALLFLAFLPYQGWLMVDAIGRTLYRVLVSRKLLLEWVTAADVEKTLKNDVSGFVRRMRIGMVIAFITLFLVGLVRPSNLIYAIPFSLLWLGSPWIGFWVSQIEEEVVEPISQAEQKVIRRLARRTWAYYEDFAGEENNYLPPDNYQVDPPNGLAYRTSPTNIGFLLLSVVAARDFGYVTTSNLVKRISDTLSTMERMESWQGHLFNWYNTKTLEPLRPFFISTVDSGNLAGYLLVVEKALKEYLNKPLWGPEVLQGLQDTFYLAFPSGEASSIRELEWPQAPWTLANLKKVLEMLNDIPFDASPWQKKLRNMVEVLNRELKEFAISKEILAKLMLQGERASNPSLDILLKSLGEPLSPLQLISIYRELLTHLPGLEPGVEEACQGAIKKALGRLEALVVQVENVTRRLTEFFWEMDFRPLYDPQHDLFAIGYNKDEEKITNSYYDLLASEARLISYLAICKREVPKKHWFKLGRALSEVNGHQGLVSWTGTMFEYLMPPLVMKHFRRTLLAKTYDTMLFAQKRYGEQRGVPWGTSESGYYAFDLQLNYQYKAFGVPDLGLKRGLIEDMVVSPYSTLLALPFRPQEAISNVKALLEDGLEGEYGLYEAVDYTPERLPVGEYRKVVESFMAHHLGMSLVAIDNLFHGNIMQRRFHANPIVKSGEILLEERMPAQAIVTKGYKETVTPLTESQKEKVDLVRTFQLNHRGLPQCLLLSNGRYSLLITDGGSGYSRLEDIQLTRWRSDTLEGCYGLQIFVKSMETNRVWSTTFEPLKEEGDSYQVTFSLDKATFTRTDDLITTYTEIVVAPEDDVEIRRVVLGNNGPTEVVLELTSYGEIVLGDHNSDLAHPAFSNLFIKTEAFLEEETLLASRRPRTRYQETPWAFHSLFVEGETVGQLQFDTNRGNFLGRTRTLANPEALEKPLSGVTGTVLDPILSLRRRVRVKPNQTVTVSWILGYGKNREGALNLAKKYRNPEVIFRAFEMAKTRSQVENHFLDLTAEEIALYQDVLPHLLFTSPLRDYQSKWIKNNRKGQSGLWAYGISGDRPIVLVTVETKEGVEVVKEALKAHEYWRTKGLMVDLVILNEDKSHYLQPLQELLRETVTVSYARHLLDTPGGIFLRHSQSMPEEDLNLFYTVARLVLDGKRPIRSQLRLQEEKLPPKKSFTKAITCYQEREEVVDLQLWNGFGGFNQDGKEYVIRLRADMNTPAPWINVIANKHFGFQVSESGSGFAWAENSRENKLTPWSNDPVADPNAEVIYLRDDESGAIWSITPQPMREQSTYTIHHGLGYSRFHHHSHNLEQEQIVFVPRKDPVKISLVRLANHSEEGRSLSLFYYLRPVLGVDEEITKPYLVTDFDDEERALLVRNNYHGDFPGRIAFIASSEDIVSYTGDRREFIGSRGELKRPGALEREGLSNRVGASLDPCMALQIKLSLPPGSKKELVFLLGQVQEYDQITDLIKQYKNLEVTKQELEAVRSYWETTLEGIQIRTPDPTMDLLMNKWLMYQNIVCRLWARSAFYQSGGAYGYRDQLQDSLNAIYVSPEITKNQLLLHAAHQFREGDVQHWWHPGVGDRGVRTRFSDDRLWLPYVLVEYLERTHDYGILGIEVPFLEGENLSEGEDEKYFTPTRSEETGSLYEHCLRAIDRALQFGEHGLPLMGSGDWNDGMSTVGNLGRGESVWLGWFLYYILKQFVPVCQRMEDYQRGKHYQEMANSLANTLEEAGWDGGWYRRAYFDDGTPLGSAINSECSIDSLAQSWAVIAGNKRLERVEMALEAVERYLINRDLGLIKLFAPPFEDGDLEPGYIKGYVAGVRENGAQYTHAATWVIKAFAILGKGDKAWELFHMINPLNHARTPIECAVYKVEPYVVAADVYTVNPQAGRGGWTWYTGAAGWLYRVGLEDILGFKLKGNRLYMNPSIPRDWPGFELTYRYGRTEYRIIVENPERISQGVGEIYLDGYLLEEDGVPLENDGQVHQVRIIMRDTPATICVAGEQERSLN